MRKHMMRLTFNRPSSIIHRLFSSVSRMILMMTKITVASHHRRHSLIVGAGKGGRVCGRASGRVRRMVRVRRWRRVKVRGRILMLMLLNLRMMVVIGTMLRRRSHRGVKASFARHSNNIIVILGLPWSNMSESLSKQCLLRRGNRSYIAIARVSSSSVSSLH